MERRRQFEEAITPLLDGLYRAALALSGRDADAQDLVQEACLRAYRRFHTYARDENFKAWMYTILRNVWLDACRRRSLEAAVPVDAEPASKEPPVPVNLDEALPDDLRRAFHALSPAHQLLVLLVDLETFSYAEAASILAIPIGSVMSGLHNARKRMRSELAGPNPRPAPR
jgi:RNA polymerase sigma-70 factor (ECF subfamily)